MGLRGRKLELAEEWGNRTDGQSFEDFLMDKVIAAELAMAEAVQSVPYATGGHPDVYASRDFD